MGFIDDPAVTAELLHRAGREAGFAGLHDDAIELLEQAVEAFRGLGEVSEARTCLGELAFALQHSGRVEESEALLRSAAAEVEPDAADRGSISLLAQLARSSCSAGGPTTTATTHGSSGTPSPLPTRSSSSVR